MKKNKENDINTTSASTLITSNNFLISTPNKKNFEPFLTNSEDKILNEFSNEKKNKNKILTQNEIILPSQTKKYLKQICDLDSRILLTFDVSFINFYPVFSENQIEEFFSIFDKLFFWKEKFLNKITKLNEEKFNLKNEIEKKEKIINNLQNSLNHNKNELNLKLNKEEIEKDKFKSDFLNMKNKKNNIQNEVKTFKDKANKLEKEKNRIQDELNRILLKNKELYDYIDSLKKNINNNNNENFFSGFSQNYQIHADDNFGFCDSFNDYKNFMENELNKQNEKLNEEIKKFKEIIEMIYDKLIEIGNNRKKYFLEGYKKIFNKEFQNEDQFKLDFPKIDLNENNNGINFEELNNNINQTFINYNEFTRVVDNWMIYKEETFNINSHNQNSNNNSICENNNNNNIDNDVFMSLIECVEFYRKLNEKYLDLNNRLILSCYLNVMKENEIKKIELKIINNENNNNYLNDLFKHFVNDVNLYEKKKEKTWKETIENYKIKLINENKNNDDINNNNDEIKKWNLNVEEIENDYKKYENLSNEIIELIKDLELMKKNNIEKNEKNLKEFKNILEIVNEKEENNKMEIDKN